MARPSCKEKLLNAAESVVVQAGAARLTLDAVAARAEVSKGGLLYHFPSKEALLHAMIARHLERVRNRRTEAAKGLPPGASSALKAEVKSALARTKADTMISSALLAVVANEPKLLGLVHAYQKERFGQLARNATVAEFGRRALILLAADGLLFHDLLQLAPFTDAQRGAIAEALLRMTDDITEEPGTDSLERRDD